MSKSHLTVLFHLSHSHLLILSSAALGSMMLFAGALDWIMRRECGALLIAGASVVKEVTDIVRHFLDVFEAASTAHDVVEAAEAVSEE